MDGKRWKITLLMVLSIQSEFVVNKNINNNKINNNIKINNTDNNKIINIIKMNDTDNSGINIIIIILIIMIKTIRI